jgi:ATP-dependent DNA helicase RecQ
MEFLRHQLDDPAATACGRCDRCLGTPQPLGVSADALAAAQAALGRPGVVLEPRAMWPTALAELGVAGKIAVAERAAPGRALGRLSDLGWGSRLRALLAEPDQPVPDDVFAAVVQVLAGWGWEQRPTQVVALPSTSRPQLVGSLAARLAQVGRLAPLGTLELVRPTQGGRSNSAQRLRAVSGAFAVPEDWALDGAPVLLVDDRSDTGWTLTEGARVLRRAGAGPVLPLVLAVDG